MECGYCKYTALYCIELKEPFSMLSVVVLLALLPESPQFSILLQGYIDPDTSSNQLVFIPSTHVIPIHFFPRKDMDFRCKRFLMEFCMRYNVIRVSEALAMVEKMLSLS